MSSGPVPPGSRHPTAVYIHNWNAPHATSLPVQPPSFNGRPRKNPLPLHALKFNPLGLFELRRHLGIPADWDTEDNQHYPNGNGFFPEFDGLRDSVPQDAVGYTARKEFGEKVRLLIFDLITMWDRTWGSTTMLLHIEGTTAPNTPPAPEYLRASVYLPPSFVRRNPDSHLPIAQIVQTFIESVGVPTVLNWTANALLRNWPLTQGGRPPAPNDIPPNTLIPTPKYAGSAHYVFHGRHAGFTFPAVAGGSGDNGEGDAGGAGGSDGGPTASPASSRYGSEEPEYSTDALSLMSALERIAQLEQETDVTATQVGELMAEAQILYSQVQAAADEQRRLLPVIASLEDQLAHANAPQSATPPTYAVSQLLTPTRPRASPLPSTPGRAISDHALPLTTVYVGVAAAASHLPAIRMMVRFVPTTRWSEELLKLGVSENVREGVLDSLARDLGMNF
ncbi:hypothetical protein B0H11DRAFT_2225809 [Mycena galericulata]|nr:hypothetical protein B0H11DRAFT_2225809 [Mycena galericulata]